MAVVRIMFRFGAVNLFAYAHISKRNVFTAITIRKKIGFGLTEVNRT